MQMLRGLLLAYDYAVAGYLLLVCLVYFVLLVLATGEMMRHRRWMPSSGQDDLFASPLAPSITVVVSAYNQRGSIERCVRALLNLRYPTYAVVVVNDGSSDDTLDLLQRRFDLRPLDAVYPEYIPTAHVRGIYVSRTEPSLTVVDKEHGGRADALNCGINLARADLVCNIDASSVLEPDALLRVAQPFMDQPEQVVATGGILRIANGARIERGSVTRVSLPRNPLAMFQVIEYLRAFLIRHASWSRMNGLLATSGAFGLFQRRLVLEVGGYHPGNGGEDAELVMRIHRYQREQQRAYRVLFVAEPICWTEVPETLPALSVRRRRWQRALAEILIAYRPLLLRPQYGVFGLLAYPYYLFVELLGPVIEATACITIPLAVLMSALDVGFAVALVLLALGYSLFLTFSALALDEFGYRRSPSLRDLLRLSLYGAMEGLGYRQLAVFWRLQGLWQAIWRGRDDQLKMAGRDLGAA